MWVSIGFDDIGVGERIVPRGLVAGEHGHRRRVSVVHFESCSWCAFHENYCKCWCLLNLKKQKKKKEMVTSSHQKNMEA